MTRRPYAKGDEVLVSATVTAVIRQPGNLPLLAVTFGGLDGYLVPANLVQHADPWTQADFTEDLGWPEREESR